MTDLNNLTDAAFRALIRQEIESHYPAELRFPDRRLSWDEQAVWIGHLRDRGWLAPGWPVERGGLGLSPIKQIIFIEEHERWGAPPYREHGVTQVGPVLMTFGTPEQQSRWLPPILAAEHHWAQGYSEPGAGSDLASLRTRAVRDDDDYVINGQKIWTTMAHHATHLYFLARTDPDVKPQRGISFFVVDITAPGISVHPIRDIAGHDELCEVFLEDVRIPVSQRIGDENNGWTIAKSLLGHERIAIGSPSIPEYGLQLLDVLAREAGVEDDPVFVDRYGALLLDVANLRDAYGLYKAQVQRGEQIGPDVSMLKIVATETFAAIADLIIETAGESGGQVDALASFYKSRPMMIYGGSNEIQRNILATTVLGLPR